MSPNPLRTPLVILLIDALEDAALFSKNLAAAAIIAEIRKLNLREEAET